MSMKTRSDQSNTSFTRETFLTHNEMSKGFILILLCSLALFSFTAMPADNEAVRLIYDTDMGNDVDDALALGVIHALESRGACELLAVTVTKDHELAAPFVDAVNTFYGRGNVPIGMVHDGATPKAGRFLSLINEKDGNKQRFPHDLKDGKDAPEATGLLRRILAEQPDGSVVIVQVGFSTNLARLLASGSDEISSLSGIELVARKVKFLSIMAGSFKQIPGKKRHLEYNVRVDIPAFRKLVREWPSAVVFSGYEIGIAVRYPSATIERDYSYLEHHILAEAYRLHNPTMREQPLWDLTSVLYAVYPGRDYFDLSARGRVTVEEDGFTVFNEDAAGSHQYIEVSPEQIVRVRDALAHLCSQPPTSFVSE